MNITDFVVLAVILLIVGLAGFYVYRAKRNGKKCIGCPCAGNCGGKCGK